MKIGLVIKLFSYRIVNLSRFCIAPLDVLKIRLQLQVRLLSDRHSSKGIDGKARYGTLNAFTNIVRHEGIRVRRLFNRYRYRSASHNDSNIGSVAGQSVCRISIHSLRSHSILYLSYHLTAPPPFQPSQQRRSLHIRGRCRSISNYSNISS